MGKKCVRSIAFVCLAAAMALAGSMTSRARAQSAEPPPLPRLTAEDLDYLGGFRLPAESVNGDSFSIGGRSMTFNPASNSLFVSTRAGRIAEVSIPAPVNSADVNALPFAGFLQPFADPTEGHLSQISNDGVAIDGLMVYGNRLYGTASIYYDANNTQRQSHYSRSLQLDQPSFSGWSQVWEAGKAGFVSGLMALVPAEWQQRLGGPAVTGQCCIPIVGRTSWGPAAFSFNPSSVGQATVAASPLLYYTAEHPTLGPWDGANPTYGATIQMGGLAIIAGTRTALYIGRNGTGPNCYGNGTSNQGLHGTYGPDGAKWCYDPTTSDKGSHAYPYRYQVWAYDLDEFVAVKEGRKQPWQVVPYGVWPIELPTPEPSVKIGGIGYDASRQLLYVSQLGADRDGYSYRPVIHAFQIDIPAVPPAAVVREVTLTVDKAAPRRVNESMTFSATAVDGVAPYQYKWHLHDGRSWTAAGDWTSSNQITWTPSAANPDYRIGVWVRSAGNAADAREAEAEMAFSIVEDAPVVTPVHSVTIAADKVAPQVPGTTVTFTATPAGGAAPHQYKWWIYEDGWKPMGSWTTSSTFAWTPTAANAGGRITVWVRSAGNQADQQESAAAMDFVIAGPAGTPPPAPSPSVRTHGVTIGANKVAPQPAGSTTTFTAVPTGGAAPHQYKWWVYNGDAWVPMTDWTTASTFNWTSATANAGGRVTVWVRSAGSTVDEAEATAAMDFVISAGSFPTAPPARAHGATISANLIAPQPPGTTITFTAAGSGGTAPYEYKWWIYDGDRWVPVGTWTSSSTFAWTPAAANAGGRVTVWVRAAGYTADEAQATAAMDFVIR
ncbi:MAG: hypothetical protein AB7P34_12725 [Vicinamibacterales bacterium]